MDPMAAVLAEIPTWESINSDDCDTSIDVFVDFKSPHAYLALRPSLALARDYAVSVNFLPYTLSYEAVGVTTSVETDMRRRPGSPAADRKARMYYRAAYPYAQLQGLPFRSPGRLLDSELAQKFFLFAKSQALDLPFLFIVFVRGWADGWRTFELESRTALQAVLAEIGADETGLDTYLETQATPAMQDVINTAESSGISGVPHYIFYDPSLGRRTGLFGREHLALIRLKLSQQGLARRAEVDPAFSHAWTGPA